MEKSTRKQLAERLLAVAAALLLLELLSALIGSALILPAPHAVAVRAAGLLADPGFYPVFFFSLSRILLGFAAGLIAGLALGVLAGRVRAAEILLYPYMVTVRSVPIASFIVLAILWLSSRELSAFISFLIVLPVVYNATVGAIHGMDPQLDEMADVYHVPFFRRLWCVWLPQVRASLLASVATAIGLAWKSGVAAELIGLPEGSIGRELNVAKTFLNTTDLFAWTVMIVLGSLLSEKAILALLRYASGERRVTRHG